MQKATFSRKSDICDGLAAQTSGFPGAFPYTDAWNPQLILVHHRSAVRLVTLVNDHGFMNLGLAFSN
jgi:hypothetical protein